MAKEDSKSAVDGLEDQEVFAGEYRRVYVLAKAERRVLEIQTKLYRWAREDSHRRFDDLFNLVSNPAFLLVAWVRVRGNKGARTAGVDGVSSRAPTGSVRITGLTTRWPRSATSPPTPTSGSWRATSKPASTRSHTQP
jgi:retron-type reverse transcriptase